MIRTSAVVRERTMHLGRSFRRIAIAIRLCALALLAGLPAASEEPPAPIVIGFMGGFVGHTNAIHREVVVANHLRRDYPSGLNVRVFENRNGAQARREVLRLLVTDNEKRRARIAIYGHSWGASEGVTLARALGRDGIPVLLTVQVDSVQKLGENDGWIPANVAEAVNYYQADGILRGRSRIRASDASRTEILGNFKFEYKTKPVSCAGYPWFARMFMKPHIEIESDPAVWQKVESLIRSKLMP